MRNAPVLFVDDNRASSQDICEFLRDHGFAVIEAHSASGAFEVIDKHRPLSALVTDIERRDGASGYEVARCARASYPRLPVVFISGTSPARHPSTGVEGSEFIAKPFAPRRLLEALIRATCLEAA